MAERGKFIGSWRLVSFEEMQPDGTIHFPYGQQPRGLLIYDASGNVAVQIMSCERARLGSQPDAEKLAAAIAGFTAFFGTFEIDETNRLITHRVTGHVLPDSVGKTLPRGYEFSGDRLILKPAANRRVVWERIV